MTNRTQVTWKNLSNKQNKEANILLVLSRHNQVRSALKAFSECQVLPCSRAEDHSFSRSSDQRQTKSRLWYCDWKEPNHPKLHDRRTVTYITSPELCRTWNGISSPAVNSGGRPFGAVTGYKHRLPFFKNVSRIVKRTSSIRTRLSWARSDRGDKAFTEKREQSKGVDAQEAFWWCKAKSRNTAGWLTLTLIWEQCSLSLIWSDQMRSFWISTN